VHQAAVAVLVDEVGVTVVDAVVGEGVSVDEVEVIVVDVVVRSILLVLYF